MEGTNMARSNITYLDEYLVRTGRATTTHGELDLIYQPLDWQVAGRQQTATGYGLKLTTPYMVLVGDRAYARGWRRVYASCVSNVASMWVLIRGQKYHLRDSNWNVNWLYQAERTACSALPVEAAHGQRYSGGD
jgi:hypothetical protein